MTAAGEMTELLQLLAVTRTRRADGGYDTTTAAPVEVWGAVEPVSAREGEEAGRLVGAVSYLVTVYRDDLPAGFSVDWRAVWQAEGGDVALNVRGIKWPRGRELFAELICDSGQVL